MSKLQQAGAEVTQPDATTLRVRGGGRLRSVDMTTEEYPGFATDLQAQYMALMTQAEGIAIIVETIFENRFMHAQELARMGANIRLDGKQAIVAGPRELTGAGVIASDLRASASLVLGALVAKGETVIDRVYHIDRGYEKIEAKLAAPARKSAAWNRYPEIYRSVRQSRDRKGAVVVGPNRFPRQFGPVTYLTLFTGKKAADIERAPMPCLEREQHCGTTTRLPRGVASRRECQARVMRSGMASPPQTGYELGEAICERSLVVVPQCCSLPGHRRPFNIGSFLPVKVVEVIWLSPNCQGCDQYNHDNRSLPSRLCRTEQ